MKLIKASSFFAVLLITVSCSTTGKLQGANHENASFMYFSAIDYASNYSDTHFVFVQNSLDISYEILGDFLDQSDMEKMVTAYFLPSNIRPGTYTYSGSVNYQTYTWPVYIKYCKPSPLIVTHFFQDAYCDDMHMENFKTKNGYCCRFYSTDDNDVFYYVDKNCFPHPNCIVDRNGKVLAKVKKDKFILAENLSSETREKVLKCLGLHQSFIRYIYPKL